ncbi:hypothetical protein QUF80_15775 [Desulfococcaceae bacterium HSG8]|nr:hypothetical protein [Desulfococcaceae bacterium HSG8]
MGLQYAPDEAFRHQKLWKSSVAIQLNDDPHEKRFLQKYLHQMKFEVAWTEPEAFMKDLYQA